ncbi:hypothetical protein G6F60_014763 [Rhizopus arrhizus]|nr:hypothetical protein G6F60_014763 [Rhizopus arrhizus]
MQHAHRILAGRVDTAVDGEAGRVDVVFRRHDLVAVQVDLDQAGRRDLVEHHAVGVDQEMLGARHLGGDVRENQVIPPEQRHQPIQGGQVRADLPFCCADLIAHAGALLANRIHPVSSPGIQTSCCPAATLPSACQTLYWFCADPAWWKRLPSVW